jgi:hypothetical protein
MLHRFFQEWDRSLVIALSQVFGGFDNGLAYEELARDTISLLKAHCAFHIWWQ